MATPATVTASLIERFLPEYEVSEAVEVEVSAASAVTYCAIRRADLADPLVAALFALREWPDRLARRLRGEAASVSQGGPITFGRIVAESEGWVELAEEPDHAFVVGSVGRFWRRDYGVRAIPSAEFASFDEPGWAKLVVGFVVEPAGEAKSRLRYEVRVAATDGAAGRRFRRYWKVIRPGVLLVMRRSLQRIRAEAEWGECMTGALADR